MSRKLIIPLVLVFVVAAAFVGLYALKQTVAPASETAEDMLVPLPFGRAYADGKEITFIHTEASDEGVAKLLTDMMSSPVLFVPELGTVPDSALANVYVFDNGPAGMGPLGFQSDVFDNPPGTAGYSPLRRLNVVTWTDPAQARELKSVAEITQAEQAGAVAIKQPGVVINMPFVQWDGGGR